MSEIGLGNIINEFCVNRNLVGKKEDLVVLSCYLFLN